MLAEPGRTTVVDEPGPTVTSDEWQAFRAGFREILATAGAGVAVLSGSLPPGVPVDAYAELGRACGEAGIRDGAALSAATVQAKPVVTPDSLKSSAALRHAIRSAVTGSGRAAASTPNVDAGSISVASVPSRS